MFFGRPILAYDVVYNRETTHNRAYYFANADELVRLLSVPDLDGGVLKQIAEENYTWRHIARQYEVLYGLRELEYQ